MTLFINPDRLQADFDAVSAIGAFQDEDGHRGVDRPALSAAHLEARAWFLARAREAGLETRVDAAGNHSAILRADRGDLTPPAPLLPYASLRGLRRLKHSAMTDTLNTQGRWAE